MNLPQIVRKLKGLSKLFRPSVPIAGLEFKDAAVRLALLEGDKLKKVAVILEPGIIENGVIKDRARLISALRKLREDFAVPKGEKMPVIAIVPSENIYVKLFDTPALEQESLEEAARLNLKSISPIKLDDGYADWQKVGTQETDGKTNILSAFTGKKAVDEYTGVSEEAGFVPVAVEFPALAISRTIKELATGLELGMPQVVINVASDGIDFIVIKNGNLHFDYFVPWKLVRGEGLEAREISFKVFESTIVREVKKMDNFYAGHWGGRIQNIILISQALNKEITDILKNNFNLEVSGIQLQEHEDLPVSWLGALGSALRGLVPRREDIFISLTAVGTEELALQEETKSFVRAWKNATFSTLGFLALIFLLADSFLAHTTTGVTDQLQSLVKVPEGSEVVQLQSEARVFNQLVEKVSFAEERSVDFAPLFSKIRGLLNSRLELSRMSVDSRQKTVLIIGEARDEAAAVKFKNTLIEEGFENVSLPLSELTPKPAGGVEFTVNFKLPLTE